MGFHWKTTTPVDSQKTELRGRDQPAIQHANLSRNKQNEWYRQFIYFCHGFMTTMENNHEDKTPPGRQPLMKRARNLLLVVLGTIALGLGITGIILPGLPTTPFLLLTAWLYLKSSEKLYKRVINNKYVGKYIRDYYEQKGMTLTQKISAISLMWFMIFISCTFFIPDNTISALIIVLGAIGTVVMGLVVPTARK